MNERITEPLQNHLHVTVVDGEITKLVVERPLIGLVKMTVNGVSYNVLEMSFLEELDVKTGKRFSRRSK